MINPSIYSSLSLFINLWNLSVCITTLVVDCWFDTLTRSDFIINQKRWFTGAREYLGNFTTFGANKPCKISKIGFICLLTDLYFSKSEFSKKSIAQIFVQILNLNKRLSLALTFLLPQINKSPYGPWVAVRVFHILYISMWNLWYSFSAFLEFQPNG